MGPRGRASIVRRTKRGIHRETANLLAWWLIGLHATILLIFWFDDPQPGGADDLFTLLWAAARKPQIYLLLALIAAAIPVTWYAGTARGPHRKWLFASWAVFLAVAGTLYAERIVTLLTIAWRHG